MPLFTLISRLSDGLPLSGSLVGEGELEVYKVQAKKLLRRLDATSPARCSFETGDYVFHYVSENGVVYLTLCEKGYPHRLAYAFLDDVQHQFEEAYLSQVEGAKRPYAVGWAPMFVASFASPD
jgi:vesicle transport protein SEC22